MKHLNTFIYAVLAGMSIAIGGVVFLSIDNKVLGSVFFSIGLFAVCTLGLNLYTGKVCYIFDNKLSYSLDVVNIWFGNLVGTAMVGYLMRATRIAGIAEKAKAMCDTKLNDSMLSIFILAIFCNIMIYFGVEAYKTNQHETGKYYGILFSIVVFIVSGYEHCIANMFYFSIANVWSLHAVQYLLVMTLGNLVGGVIFPLAKKLKNRSEQKVFA